MRGVQLQREIDNHAAFDLTLFHFVEDIVDVFDRAFSHFRHDLAFSSELEGFSQVFTRTNQRADDFDTVQYQARNVEAHGFRRQTNRYDARTSANSVNRRVESGFGNGSNDRRVSTAHFFLNQFCSVFFGRVNDHVRAHFLSQFQLLIVDVDRDDFSVEDVFRILQRQVTQTAQTVDGNPFAGFDVGYFDRFVRGNTRARYAAGCCGIQTVRYFDSVVSSDDAFFRHTTINGVTRVFDATAQRFVTADAVFAVATALEEPCNACTVAYFQRGHARTNFFDDTYTFMAQDNASLVTEITIFDVQVGVTHTTALHLQQGFAVLQRTQFFVLNFNVMVFAYNCCFHDEIPFLVVPMTCLERNRRRKIRW
ncbi:DEAD-box family ATP-dependent helicase [Zymobacter palmae]|uniref:DEAD-box family ATP-dependent helicase n=1 Tax=Zymobacter palmae TaxID=33074 RepID=A0A348HHQ1_9GAMM|nr:DEAD-box family ATP-dependent helicase [Zymobacter palmae]